MNWLPRGLRLVLLACALGACGGADRVVIRKLPSSSKPKKSASSNMIVARFLRIDGSLEFLFQGPPKGPLSVRFALDKGAYPATDARWGYYESDLARLRESHESHRSAAFVAASARGDTQAQLEADLHALAADFKRARHDYILSRGFKFLPDGRVGVDLSALVRSNAVRMQPLARALEQSTKNFGLPSDWMINAAAAVVQSSLDYRPVPPVIGEGHTGGVWPPVTTLAYGWGDCDTKAALLAAILANIPGIRILGIEISGHYLLAISKRPGKHDSFLNYHGQKFVLIEAAGPDWIPPGQLSKNARRLFEEGRPYNIEQLY